MATALWDAVRSTPDNLATASALFHQVPLTHGPSATVKFIRCHLLYPLFLLEVLIGEASPELITHSRHCHYGLVVALFVLARHTMAPQLDAKISEGQNYAALAMRLLGGFAALDFLEDSSWPLSSLA